MRGNAGLWGAEDLRSAPAFVTAGALGQRASMSGRWFFAFSSVDSAIGAVADSTVRGLETC